MADAVLDSSAVLAFLREEPGADEVLGVMPRSIMSAVNVSEVVAKLVERGMESATAVELVRDLPFELADHDAELAYRTGTLRKETMEAGLSLGDRACLALGLSRGLPVLTTDRAWSRPSLGLEVRVVR